MKVSIITPVLNDVGNIDCTIKSVLDQTWRGIEHIVADGGSNDGTLERLHRYKQLKILNGPDSGIYQALNRGIRISTGEVVGWLHSGDVFFDNAVVDDVAKAFESDDSIGMYCGSVIYRNDENTVFRTYKSAPLSMGRLRLGIIPAHTGTFVRRNLIEALGGYDESFAVAGDFDFFRRALQVLDPAVAYSDRPVTYMSFGGKSAFSIKSAKFTQQEIKRSLASGGVYSPLPLLTLRYFLKAFEFSRKPPKLGL